MSLDGKTILITGGTGSFGKKFVATALADHSPKAIRVFSRDEYKQYQMEEAFAGEERLRFLIGDMRDVDRLRRACSGVDLVVHAAAMKQVTACEYNPFEAIQTNVVGAENLIRAALDTEVESVVALSTDKAVSPVNLYGASKLCAEKLFVRGNAYSGPSPTRMGCVRYGNVVGSRGSVVPLFLRQRNEGKITITDERMTRFWITLDEAVEFVISFAEELRGGEVAVPKIPSTRVTAIADAIAPGVEKEFVGIRAGEKLHEDLIMPDEARHTIELEDRYLILPENPSWSPSRPWPEGKPLEDGFRYSSDTNEQWLEGDSLRAAIEAVESMSIEGET